MVKLTIVMVQGYLPNHIWVKFLHGSTRCACTTNITIHLARTVGICVYCLYCFMHSVYLN